MDTPSFGSISAECDYWKQRSQQYLEELMEVKKEYAEFVEQSRDIEIEMDATLEQKERKIKEMATKATIYERDKQVLMDKLNSQSIEMSSLGNQLTEMTTKFEAMKRNLRVLEQTNDDLEQAERIASESKETAENLLFEQYERYALLEEELDEKHDLEVELQRLRDEVRDLKQELMARDLVKREVNPLDSTEPDDPLRSGSNMQLLIRNMVSQLDNLQTKLKAHREKRSLPPAY